MITKERNTTQPKVWFITGGSTGLGRSFTEIALSRGDSVMVIARNIEPLKDLVSKFPHRIYALSADVTDRNAVFASVNKCIEVFGRTEVVITMQGNSYSGW